MRSPVNVLRFFYWTLTAAAFAACMVMMLVYTPVEAQMGPVQKIFYVHLPTAMNTFVAAFIVFVASVGYLWHRQPWWDDLAAAAGKVTALFCAIVLLTGMTWARSAWGMWWTWSPRLTFSLVLFLLFVVYLLIRPSIESPQRRAVVSAVYGVVAFLDVPLVYLSVKLMPDIHPSSITLEPAMKHTLWAWFVPVTMLMAGLISANYALNRMVRQREEARGARMAPAPTRVGAGRAGLEVSHDQQGIHDPRLRRGAWADVGPRAAGVDQVAATVQGLVLAPKATYGDSPMFKFSLGIFAALTLCWLAAAREPTQTSQLPSDHPPVQPQLPPNHPQLPQLPADHPDVGRPPPVPAEPKDGGEPVVVPPPNPEDVKSIDAVIKAYYDSLCGAKGQQRDWNRLRSLMFPDMRFITTRPMDDNLYVPMILSLEQFIAINTSYFEGGGYYERESHREVDQFGTIAQVFSTYESRHDIHEHVPYSRGINSMQLLNDGSRWWIVNVVWDYERPESNPLPEQYGGAPVQGG